MPALHHVVIIHGMGLLREEGEIYSHPLQQAIGRHMGADADRLRYYEVNWSSIGQSEEDTLLRHNILPDQWHTISLRHPIDSLLETIDRLKGTSNELRRFMVGSVGDVFTYLTMPGKRDIQQRLKHQIFAARQAQIDAGVPPPHYISIMAHSLGSVVTYDLARYFGDTQEGQQEAGSAALANLFTFGSPLALFSLLEYGQERQPANAPPPAVLSDGQSNPQSPEQREPEARRPYSTRGIKLNLADGKWLNFYDQQDPVACTLHDLYSPRNSADDRSEVEDIPVQTGVLHAHTAYWQNDEMAAAIAKQLRHTLEALDTMTR
jgi:hypothetical protein